MDDAYTIDGFRCKRQFIQAGLWKGNVHTGIAQAGIIGANPAGLARYYSSETTFGDPFALIYKFNANLMRDYGGMPALPRVTHRHVHCRNSFFHASVRLENGLTGRHSGEDEFEAQAHALKAALEMTRRQVLQVSQGAGVVPFRRTA